MAQTAAIQVLIATEDAQTDQKQVGQQLELSAESSWLSRTSVDSFAQPGDAISFWIVVLIGVGWQWGGSGVAIIYYMFRICWIFITRL